jgi:Antitoxin VbhA
VAERKKVTDFARAANMRQGYVRDPVLEAANDRFVAGEITLDELRDEMLEAARRLS